ncbi:uncharacterized protein [Musca autumnalis]|uniref:uncharacterized protein n=1 Tax=Musca autumnalis TaxID=221902 RepID=UPI003CF2917B
MKVIGILLIWFFALSVARGQEWCVKGRLRDTFRRCAISHGVGNAEISRLIYGLPSRSGREKCFRACSMIECRYFNVDGTLKHDTPYRIANHLAIGDSFKSQLVPKLAANCLKHIPLHNNVCETAEMFINCMVATSPVPLALDRAVN